MSVIELLANVLTVLSVGLTVWRRKALYPAGIAATVLFFFVFWQARLYASAGLQVYFTAIQIYGWWFWSRGDRGHEPPIGDWSWPTVAGLGLAAGAFTALVAGLLYRFTDAKAPLADTAILALSVLAQFLLDRKQMKNWTVWGLVDAISVYVYAKQGLWLTAALYLGLFANVFFGAWMWRRARAREAAGVEQGA